jgi:23S rRNA pseudouridine1911/1915/1917 synthase
MLFARTRAAELKLVGMFRRHTIEREYCAVCVGRVEPQKIESFLIRDRGDGHRGSLPADASEELQQSAQRAVTHIVSSESFVVGAPEQVYSVIRCRLETGRTHQIRIHLAELGHMLCGDKIYARDAQGNVTEDRSGAPRHALHSDRLTFTHPMTGQHLKFEMPMPPDLATWLQALRRS